MVRETAMRIGIAAQSYTLPSPTGIADFSLRTPGERRAFSGLLSRGPFNGLTLQMEEQIPVVPKTLSVDVCGAYYKNFLVDDMRHDGSAAVGLTLRWRPSETVEVIPFWSYLPGGGRQVLPAVYTDGTVTLPVFRERDLAGPTWTNQGWRQTTLGAVAKSAFTDRWSLNGGLFHSLENDPWSLSPYLQLNADGTADSTVDVAPPLRADSTSGEVRLTGVATHGGRRQQLQFDIRGRSVARSYGGDDTLDFGNIAIRKDWKILRSRLSRRSTAASRRLRLVRGRWTAVSATHPGKSCA